MTTPSTADSKEAGSVVRPLAEPGSLGPGGTHAVVKGQVQPRLLHEHDESSDSGTVEPTERLHQAARDTEDGMVDRERSPRTQQHYSELTKSSQPQSNPDPNSRRDV